MLTKAQEQFMILWKRQSPANRLVLVALVIGSVALAVVFFRWSSTPTYAVAFTSLSEADAGQIVEKLDELQIPYQLRGGGTILVPSTQIYDVRLKMARDGLPEGTNVGFELFSGNTLGMTEFTQRVNYQRALEGELERTIGSMDVIDSVNVHVVAPERTLLEEDQSLTTASVTIKEKPGQRLDASQVRAITHLVASSVEGLNPENVVVVDISGNMLASGSLSGESSNMAMTDTRRANELAAAAEIQKKVQDLLNTTLGPGKSVVKANVVMDWTERETVKQSYDPASATIRSSQLVTETMLTSGDGVGGIPGAMSNLPPVTNTVDAEGQASEYARSEKTLNYEITQTETKEVETPGVIQRVSLSVMVDSVTDPAQLETLQAAVAAAAGINEARGDQLEVKSLVFDRSDVEAQAAEMAETSKTDMYWRYGQIGAAVLALAIVLLYVQRLLNNLRLASTAAWTPVLRPVAEMALGPGANMAGAAAAMQPGESAPQIHQPAPPPPAPVIELPRIEMPKEVVIPALTEADEKLQQLVIELADENPAAIAEVIQIWLNEAEK